MFHHVQIKCSKRMNHLFQLRKPVVPMGKNGENKSSDVLEHGCGGARRDREERC
uniref:Uncharacterized protein n=1 Tax=Arundo donax TaxID=35708 RepID=A0A0A8Y2Y8_ARUDO